jgi:hypothetical protein
MINHSANHNGCTDSSAIDMSSHKFHKAFNGVVNYAFGNKVELKVTKSVTYGDNFCEVMIRIP